MPRKRLDFDAWDVEQAEFQGFVKAKFESLEKIMNAAEKRHDACRLEVNGRCTECEKGIEKNSEAIVDVKLKSVAAASVTGFAGGFIAGLLNFFR